MEKLCVGLEKLGEETLECMIVDVRVRIKKLKVDIDKAL